MSHAAVLLALSAPLWWSPRAQGQANRLCEPAFVQDANVSRRDPASSRTGDDRVDGRSRAGPRPVAMLGTPTNDDCEDAPFQAIPAGGGTVAFEGNNSGATSDCAALDHAEAWIAFSIQEIADVTLTYCDSPEFFDLASVALFDSCPCGTPTFGTGDDLCPKGNAVQYWACLAPGTYYYPVLSEYPYSEGDYVIDIMAIPVANPEDCAGCAVDTVYGQAGDAQGHGSDAVLAAASDAGADLMVFDNHLAGGAVDTIRWWGILAFFDGGWTECDKDSDYRIRFYEDNGNQPGAPLADLVVTPDRSDAGFDTGGYFVWRFDAPLDAAVTVPETGWASVVGLDDAQNPDCWFLWATANGDGQSRQGVGPPGSLNDYDLGFCLRGPVCGNAVCEPEHGEDCATCPEDCAMCCNSDLDCNDDNACTDDACANGVCVYTNNAVPCDDEDPCTSNDACGSGTCEGTYAQFLYADVNATGFVDVTDVTCVIRVALGDASCLVQPSADIGPDCAPSGSVDISDVTAVITQILSHPCDDPCP